METDTKEPTLSDLRDSGQLEEDSHRVVMLHWTESQHLDQETRPYKILQPKFRDGPTTAVSGINFHAPTTRWAEAQGAH
jgi:replicative DNA helicase